MDSQIPLSYPYYCCEIRSGAVIIYLRSIYSLEAVGTFSEKFFYLLVYSPMRYSFTVAVKF